MTRFWAAILISVVLTIAILLFSVGSVLEVPGKRKNTTTIATTTTTIEQTTTTTAQTTTTSGGTTTTISDTTTTTAWVINVLDFGAKGDGITDDTQAIQNAIDFTAGIRTLAETAPASMPSDRRALYQAYEDARRAQLGLPPVKSVQEKNRWLVFVGLLLAGAVIYPVLNRLVLNSE